MKRTRGGQRTWHGVAAPNLRASGREDCDEYHVPCDFSAPPRAPSTSPPPPARAANRAARAGPGGHRRPGAVVAPDDEVDAAGAARPCDPGDLSQEEPADANPARRLANVEILEEQATLSGPARKGRIENREAQRGAALLGDQALAGVLRQALRIVLGPAEGCRTRMRGVLGDEGGDQRTVRGDGAADGDGRRGRAQPAAPAAWRRPVGRVVAVRMLSAMTAGTRMNTAPGWPASSRLPTSAGVSVAPRSRPE